MSEYTKGPWTVEGRTVHTSAVGDWNDDSPMTIRGDNYDIATITKTWTGVHHANANLIAAAPDLLSVLRELASWPDVLEVMGPELCDKVTDVIAKAEGR